jgi:hypothetical protein
MITISLGSSLCSEVRLPCTYQTAFSVPAPSSAGTYYFWCAATDSTGAIVSSCVQTTAVGGSTPQAFTITSSSSSGSGSPGAGDGSTSGSGGSSGSSGSSGAGSSGGGSSSPPGPLAFTYLAGSGTGVLASEIIGLFGGAANMQTPLVHGSSVTPSITWQQVESVASVVWWFDTDGQNTDKAASTVAIGTINTNAGSNSGAVFFYGGNAPATAGSYYGKIGFYDSSNTLLGAFVTQAITVT